jgi:hypothetical protein
MARSLYLPALSLASLACSLARQNFSLFPSMTIKLEKAFLTFMGFEGTDPMLFRLRLKNVEVASQLKAAIEGEVARL